MLLLILVLLLVALAGGLVVHPLLFLIAVLAIALAVDGRLR